MSKTRRPRGDRKCWRAPGNAEMVMFHAHYEQSFAAHSHDVLTVILVTGGTVLVEVDESPTEVRAGELVLIGAHQVHAARPINADGWSMRSMHLPARQVLGEDSGGDIAAKEPVAFRNPVNRTASRAIDSFFVMHGCSETDAALNEQMDRQQKFLTWLRKSLPEFDPQSSRCAVPDAMFQRAKDLVSKAAFTSRYIDYIAEEIGISTFALNRLFKKTLAFLHMSGACN